MANKTLFIFLLVVVLRENLVAALKPKVVAGLKDLAKDYGSPFSKIALGRLSSEVFGSGDSARSTEVVIINASKKNFKLVSNSCDHGGYSTNFFPEHKIKAKTSSAFRTESHGTATGVECTTRYDSEDDISFIEVTLDNPYIGSNSIRQSCSKNLEITGTVGSGNNNQVRFIVENKQ